MRSALWPRRLAGMVRRRTRLDATAPAQSHCQFLAATEPANAVARSRHAARSSTVAPGISRYCRSNVSNASLAATRAIRSRRRMLPFRLALLHRNQWAVGWRRSADLGTMTRIRKDGHARPAPGDCSHSCTGAIGSRPACGGLRYTERAASQRLRSVVLEPRGHGAGHAAVVDAIRRAQRG